VLLEFNLKSLVYHILEGL